MGSQWSQEDWRRLEKRTAAAILSARNPRECWSRVVRSARGVLREYSTSFFIVTRFLPPEKRGQVEVVYAAVRYPDEVVDTFPLSCEAAVAELNNWQTAYERALGCANLTEALESGVNCFAAAFAQVVRHNAIPPEHYLSFLDAMRLDAAPRPFETPHDLVESYIYGSATVVGYFLAYIYGPSAAHEMPRALTSSRDLAIALQLTNFLRDVVEDRRRGRVYLPLDMLRAEGLTVDDVGDSRSLTQVNRVLRNLSAIAESHYAAAETNVDAFAPDCRIAIQACINVYRQLNIRIGNSREGILHRESVPIHEKFRVLPPSKYWRLPLAYLGAL